MKVSVKKLSLLTTKQAFQKRFPMPSILNHRPRGVQLLRQWSVGFRLHREKLLCVVMLLEKGFNRHVAAGKLLL